MEHDPDTRRYLRQRKEFLTFQTFKMEEYLWIGTSERDESLRDQPTCYAFKKGCEEDDACDVRILSAHSAGMAAASSRADVLSRTMKSLVMGQRSARIL